MIEHNTLTDEKKCFCDRCSKELTDEAVIFTTGDCICQECFENSYSIQKVEDYLNQ